MMPVPGLGRVCCADYWNVRNLNCHTCVQPTRFPSRESVDMLPGASLAELCEQDFPDEHEKKLSRDDIAKVCGAKALSRVGTVGNLPGFTMTSSESTLDLVAGCEVSVSVHLTQWEHTPRRRLGKQLLFLMRNQRSLPPNARVLLVPTASASTLQLCWSTTCSSSSLPNRCRRTLSTSTSACRGADQLYKNLLLHVCHDSAGNCRRLSRLVGHPNAGASENAAPSHRPLLEPWTDPPRFAACRAPRVPIKATVDQWRVGGRWRRHAKVSPSTQGHVRFPCREKVRFPCRCKETFGCCCVVVMCVVGHVLHVVGHLTRYTKFRSKHMQEHA